MLASSTLALDVAQYHFAEYYFKMVFGLLNPRLAPMIGRRVPTHRIWRQDI